MFWLNIARKDNFFFVIVQQIGNFSTEAVYRPRFFASLRMTNKPSHGTPEHSIMGLIPNAGVCDGRLPSTIVKTALPIPDKNCDAKTETAVDANSLAAQVWHDSYI